MQAKFFEEKMKYDGHQLRSLYSYAKFGIMGDSIVSWVGACNVPFAHMVDMEDALQRSKIAGDEMLHFLVEIFDRDLFSAVCLQRILAAIIKDCLLTEFKVNLQGLDFRRDGDDLFWGDKKLSISIASKSPVSVMVHFAVNIVNEGTPVQTCALSDWGVNPKVFSEKIMSQFVSEFDSITLATRKVKALN